MMSRHMSLRRKRKADSMRQWLQDLFIALSLANLCFLRVWSQLLTYTRADTYLMLAPPSPQTYVALMLDVLVLAGLVWLGITLVRRYLTGWVLGLAYSPSAAPAAQHPPLARRARGRRVVRVGPGCCRCRASALGALQVAGRGRQGGGRRRWQRTCRRPPARASHGREARRATRWPGVCQGRRAGRGSQRSSGRD